MYFFFSAFLEKKNTDVFLFFPEIVWKPLTQLSDSSLWEKGTFALFRCIFFFTTKMCIFFFPWNSLPATHSLVLKGRKKKIQPRKKKYSFSLTHSIFPQKGQKINFSGEKKKYGTFALVPLFHKHRIPSVPIHHNTIIGVCRRRAEWRKRDCQGGPRIQEKCQ